MSRVTPTEVKAIVTTSLDDTSIQIWIDAANSIVNANEDCIGGDEALLTQIELQLSAHFVYLVSTQNTATSGHIIEEGPDGFKTKYSSPQQFEQSIDSSNYGQVANMLSNGCLTGINDQRACAAFF